MSYYAYAFILKQATRTPLYVRLPPDHDAGLLRRLDILLI